VRQTNLAQPSENDLTVPGTKNTTQSVCPAVCEKMIIACLRAHGDIDKPVENRQTHQ
jgi:hypothetical protein